MSLGRLFGTVMKYAPKIGKAFGQLSEGSKKFGTLVQAGKQFGSVANQISGGKLANSDFGRGLKDLTSKVESANDKVGKYSSMAPEKIEQATEKLRNM